MRELPRTLQKYAIAIGVGVAAVFLRKLLDPLLGTDNAYHTVWLAVMFAAFYCGIGPAVVTVVISAVGVWYWLLPRYESLTAPRYATLFGMAGFLVLSAVIIALGETTRRIMVKRQRAEEELKKAHVELEKRVQERTVALAERTAALERKQAELVEQAAMLDLANDAIFVRSATDTISYWNEGAERLYGWTKEEAVGRLPHDLLHTEFPQPLASIKALETWEGELQHTKRDGTKITVVSHWTTLRNANGAPKGWLEINTDITRRKRAEEAARSLSGRILALQDEERRRIAKELHDSLGQYLVALKMNLDSHASQQAKLNAIASESSDIVDRCLAETRTISHLLHPPLLDEAGFYTAARDYIDGFSRRSGIIVEFNTPSEVARLQPEIERMLFRTVQEALTNVHKHAGASRVVISLTMEEKQVHLQVTDNGKGIPPERLDQLMHGVSEIGVGLAGMRERVRQFNGAFDIRSDGTGTVLTVTTPRLDSSVPHDPGVVSAA
jgi:PAS domain S-box-containing protein